MRLLGSGVTLDLVHEGEDMTCVSVGRAVPSLQTAAHDSELYTVLVVHREYSVPHAEFKGAQHSPPSSKTTGTQNDWGIINNLKSDQFYGLPLWSPSSGSLASQPLSSLHTVSEAIHVPKVPKWLSLPKQLRNLSRGYFQYWWEKQIDTS